MRGFLLEKTVRMRAIIQECERHLQTIPVNLQYIQIWTCLQQDPSNIVVLRWYRQWCSTLEHNSLSKRILPTVGRDLRNPVVKTEKNCWSHDGAWEARYLCRADTSSEEGMEHRGSQECWHLVRECNHLDWRLPAAMGTIFGSCKWPHSEHWTSNSGQSNPHYSVKARICSIFTKHEQNPEMCF